MAETSVLNYSPTHWHSEAQGSNRIRSLICFYEELTRQVQRQTERRNPPQPRFVRHRRLPTSEDKRASLILGSPTSPSQLKNSYAVGESCCAICGIEFEAEEIEAEEDLKEKKQLECKHVYHYKCIFRWTKRQNTCPLCRRPFDYRWRAPQSSSSSPSAGIRNSIAIIRPFLGERI